jgi:hypothetical protein
MQHYAAILALLCVTVLAVFAAPEPAGANGKTCGATPMSGDTEAWCIEIQCYGDPVPPCEDVTLMVSGPLSSGFAEDLQRILNQHQYAKRVTVDLLTSPGGLLRKAWGQGAQSGKQRHGQAHSNAQARARLPFWAALFVELPMAASLPCIAPAFPTVT